LDTLLFWIAYFIPVVSVLAGLDIVEDEWNPFTTSHIPIVNSNGKIGRKTYNGTSNWNISSSVPIKPSVTAAMPQTESNLGISFDL